MLAKSKLNSKETLISKALIDSVISHDEFVLIKFEKDLMIWKKKVKFQMINKHVWCNKKYSYQKKSLLKRIIKDYKNLWFT